MRPKMTPYEIEIGLLNGPQLEHSIHRGAAGWLEAFSNANQFDGLCLFSPFIVPEQQNAQHDAGLEASEASDHNQSGIYNSSLIQCKMEMPSLLGQQSQGMLARLLGTPDFCRPQTHFTSFANDDHDQPLFASPSEFQGRPGYGMEDESTHTFMTCDEVEKDGSIINSTTSKAAVPLGVSFDSEQQFRYNVTTLQAPTAMCQSATEHPITYLNKGHMYLLSVSASQASTQSMCCYEYRTSIRVTFEEEEQRSDPNTSWKLWQENRGLDRRYAQQTRLAAVELADLSQAVVKSSHYQSIRLEKSSVDGFRIAWTANPKSTDQQCVPVRLCVKTTGIRSIDGREGDFNSEMCYCKVKLFRSHGAERKMSHDLMHLMKKIRKLDQKISDHEQGKGRAGLVHSQNFINGGQIGQGAGGQKRSRSKKLSSYQDLHADLAFKHATLQSSRQSSVLSVRGDEKDDPDLYPVAVSFGPEPCFSNAKERGSRRESLGPPEKVLQSQNCPASSGSRNIYLYRPSKIAKVSHINFETNLTCATHDSSRAIACFYFQFTLSQSAGAQLHPIYLNSRTSCDLQARLAGKL